MSRTPVEHSLPPLPPGVAPLSQINNLLLDDAVKWLKDALGFKEITHRYLRDQTNIGELPCRIIAKKRYYSTADLYEFIMTRPTFTAHRTRNILPPQPHNFSERM